MDIIGGKVNYNSQSQSQVMKERNVNKTNERDSSGATSIESDEGSINNNISSSNKNNINNESSNSNQKNLSNESTNSDEGSNSKKKKY